MISGTGTGSSLQFFDTENSRIQSTGYQKTVFATKTSAGASSINLASLVLPPEMSQYGFVNPSTAQIAGSSLLLYPKNLTLTSSLRGPLIQGLSYQVVSSLQINLIGFTTAAGEIFTGIIDYTATTGNLLVGATVPPSSGTLLAGQTDFVTSSPFLVNQNSSTSLGAVLVFVNSGSGYQLVTRNTGNSSVVVDGSYYEVPALNGLGTIIRFNSSTGSSRGILIVSNGVLYERPSGSISATMEHLNGQLVNMAGYVATLASQSVNTILGGAPSYIDLAAFGNKVYAAGLFPLGGVIPVMSHLTGSYSLPTSGSVDLNGYMRCDGAAIPGGLALSGTTPDLTGGKFIYGTNGSGSGANFLAGATGGNSGGNVTLTSTQLPSHSHGSGSFATSIGIQNGAYSVSTGAATLTGSAPTLTGTTSFASTSHSHTAPIGEAGGNTYYKRSYGLGGIDFAITALTNLGTTGSSGAVQLALTSSPSDPGGTVTISGGGYSISYTAQVLTGTAPSLTGSNTVAGTSSSAGTGSAFSILPPYVAAVYLIRVN